jgi:hypothetical protein
MALKPCRECKKKVSTEALTCPNCGVPNPTIKSIKKDKRVNIQHGVEYCSNCGTELPSGPPCNNPRCRLAEISSQQKNKPYEIAWCENISCKSRHKQLKIPTILLGQQQCSVCDSVMSLVSKKQLAQLETIKKYLEPHKKIIDVKKREDAVKRIKEKHFGDNNSLTKVYGFWHGKGGLAKSFWLYFIVANMIGNFMLLGAATQSLSLVYLILVVIIIWNIFAIIGVFNAADIYKAKKIKSNESYGYATASKWAVVLLTMSGIGQALN